MLRLGTTFFWSSLALVASGCGNKVPVNPPPVDSRGQNLSALSTNGDVERSVGPSGAQSGFPNSTSQEPLSSPSPTTSDSSLSESSQSAGRFALSASGAGPSTSSSTSQPTCNPSGQSIALNFFPQTIPYNLKLSPKDPLPKGSAVRIYRMTDDLRRQWYNLDGTESAFYKSWKDYLTGFPGIDSASLQGWEIPCYALRGGGAYGYVVYGPPRDGAAPKTSTNQFPIDWTVSASQIERVLVCSDLCPSCRGDRATSLSDYVDASLYEFAQYGKGCGIKAINGDGVSEDLKVTVHDTTFKAYPQVQQFNGPLKDDTTFRLKEVVGGYDNLSCPMRDPKQIAEYAGPKLHKCPCVANKPCTVKLPKENQTLACKRIEELNPKSYANELDLGDNSPTNWISFDWKIVTDSTGTHPVYSGNGKTVTVSVDIPNVKEIAQGRLRKIYNSQLWQRCFGGPNGATQGSCGNAKISSADIEDALNRLDGCAIWNMPKSVKLSLQTADYLGGVFSFGVNETDPVLTCEWGRPIYKMNFGSDSNNYKPGETSGFLGYDSHGMYEVRPTGSMTITPKGDVVGGINFTLKKIKDLENFIRPPGSSWQLYASPFSPIFVGLSAAFNKPKADAAMTSWATGSGGNTSYEMRPNYLYSDIAAWDLKLDAKISFKGF